MPARARIEEFRVGLKKPPTLAPTHGAQAASQRVSLLFIYYFLLIKNKNNNKYTPGWMDWIEIPLHEFAAYLVELCPSHSPSVNVKEGTFHPIIPTDRFKLFQTSALCIGKADVVPGLMQSGCRLAEAVPHGINSRRYPRRIFKSPLPPTTAAGAR